MINIIGKRYYYFLFSLLLIVPGLIILAVNGMPLAIDFKGGSLLELQFPTTNLPETSDVIAIYHDFGFNEVQVQTAVGPSGEKDILVIRSPFMDDQTKVALIDRMQTQFKVDNITVNRFDSVGPVIAQQVTNRAALAIAVAALAVVLYITYAFRGIQHAFRYGVLAIVAMIHDILVVFSVTAIGSVFWGWQMDSMFLTALLTVIGFSTQDKIVVFDRIRENSSFLRKISFEKLVNHSIVQTLQRSINTQLMTVEFMLLALALFGGVTLQEFSLILLVGLLSGTYSSIFIAAPLLVVWETQEWKTWFRKKEAVA